jgi:sRNA-binding protein
MFISREDSEHAIRVLAERYPKCFFQEPRLRRPLKHDIIADLQQDGCPLAVELMTAALNWYQGAFGYLYALQAGTKRVDLDGNEVGTVTPQEAAEAIKQVQDANARNATKTLMALHNARRIPDDQLKKLDALPLPVLKSKATIAPELTRVQEAIATANTALNSCNDNLEMRAAIAVAVLGVVVKEAQQAIAQLGAQ